MSVRYRTDYANEVHQLVVSVSRHLWIGADERIHVQKKPFEISLSKLATAPKRHLVHYLVRDHFSGAFYGEIAVAPTLPEVREFLVRAWSRKDRLAFCGVPDHLTIPKTVEVQFADTRAWVKGLGVQVIEATSGFQAGVRDLKTWEADICHQLAWYPDGDAGSLPALSEAVTFDLTQREIFNRLHVARWRAGLRELRFPLPNDPVLTLVPEASRHLLDDARDEFLRRFLPREV